MAIDAAPQTASQRITDEVTSWPGVTADVGSRGEWAFTVGRKEVGHLHGDHVAHFAFSRALRAELLEAGRVEPHPVDSPGLAARPIRGDADVEDVIALMRLNYDRHAARKPPAARRE